MLPERCSAACNRWRRFDGLRHAHRTSGTCARHAVEPFDGSRPTETDTGRGTRRCNRSCSHGTDRIELRTLGFYTRPCRAETCAHVAHARSVSSSPVACARHKANAPAIRSRASDRSAFVALRERRLGLLLVDRARPLSTIPKMRHDQDSNLTRVTVVQPHRYPAGFQVRHDARNAFGGLLSSTPSREPGLTRNRQPVAACIAPLHDPGPTLPAGALRHLGSLACTQRTHPSRDRAALLRDRLLRSCHNAANTVRTR